MPNIIRFVRESGLPTPRHVATSITVPSLIFPITSFWPSGKSITRAESEIGRLARAETAKLQAGTDVDGDMDYDTDDVLADISDGAADGVQHPDPWYELAAQAHAAVAHLNGWGAAAEAGRDEDEDNRHMSSYTGRSGERYF